MMKSIRIWDLPTRLFHWLLAAAIFALIATGMTGGDAIVWPPKMIVTKKERANMVYAVKISFKNDGTAKIGMPGDVVFKK